MKRKNLAGEEELGALLQDRIDRSQKIYKALLGHVLPGIILLGLMAFWLQFARASDNGGFLKNVLRPSIAGDWWKIADEPELGTLRGTNQQPVDFGIWQANDGTWQLWSCIRNTKEPGFTRLFYSWEGKQLTDTNWEAKGITMQGRVKFGEPAGGLQAPFVFRDADRFVMFYGNWESICSAYSVDGKNFNRILNNQSNVALFSEGAGCNTRDPMVLRIGDLWHCYYTAYPQSHGADYCRTSPDLIHWGKSRLVAKGGQAENGPYSAECPFVVELEPGQFYLFRTQKYGGNAQTRVYYSDNPLDFGVEDDQDHFVCELPVAAPEIIRYNNQWFIAGLLPSLKGIQISHLFWIKRASMFVHKRRCLWCDTGFDRCRSLPSPTLLNQF